MNKAQLRQETLAYFSDTIGHFLAYFATAALVGVVFLAAYVALTPHKEFKLIREGNGAAATQLVGTFLGFAIPVAVVIGHSVGLLDMILWAGVAAVVQLAVFFVIAHLFSGIEKRIEDNCMASGVFIGGMGLATGILQAGCMIP